MNSICYVEFHCYVRIYYLHIVQIEKEQISEVVASEIELVAFVTDSLTNNI